jgi:hypothetical protein
MYKYMEVATEYGVVSKPKGDSRPYKCQKIFEIKSVKKFSGLKELKKQRTMVNGCDCGIHFCKCLKQSVQNWDVSITAHI